MKTLLIILKISHKHLYDDSKKISEVRLVFNKPFNK